MAAATGAAFAESYRGLYLWARGHDVPGFWAAAWPLQVDTFVAVGELALFVALLDRWPVRARWPAWAVTAGGLGISVAGNIGHVAGHQLASRATAAVPPLAAAAALAVGLGVLKRIVAAQQQPTRASTRRPVKTAAGNGHGRRTAAETEALVRDALAAGHTSTASLAAATGLAERTVRRYRPG